MPRKGSNPHSSRSCAFRFNSRLWRFKSSKLSISLQQKSLFFWYTCHTVPPWVLFRTYDVIIGKIQEAPLFYVLTVGSIFRHKRFYGRQSRMFWGDFGVKKYIPSCKLFKYRPLRAAKKAPVRVFPYRLNGVFTRYGGDDRVMVAFKNSLFRTRDNCLIFHQEYRFLFHPYTGHSPV